MERKCCGVLGSLPSIGNVKFVAEDGFKLFVIFSHKAIWGLGNCFWVGHLRLCLFQRQKRGHLESQGIIDGTEEVFWS